MTFALRDQFDHRDGRTVIVSTIVHDPPWSHDIPGWDATYDSETVIWTLPARTSTHQLAALLKHTLRGHVSFDHPAYHEAFDRACWERVAERHAAIVKRARRGRRR